MGYIAASIKDIADIRVGDTITLRRKSCRRAAAGLQAGAADGVLRHLPRRRRGLRGAARTRWKSCSLNDAALSFEPETSVALGYGFRCGFLGLLHMEIIQERLEREFDLDLVTTAPSVVYKVNKTDGTMRDDRQPHEPAARAGDRIHGGAVRGRLRDYAAGLCGRDHGAVSG